MRRAWANKRAQACAGSVPAKSIHQPWPAVAAMLQHGQSACFQHAGTGCRRHGHMHSSLPQVLGRRVSLIRQTWAAATKGRAGGSSVMHQGNQWNDSGLLDEEFNELDDWNEAQGSAVMQQLLGPSRVQMDEFQALWADYGRELQLSKETVAMISSQVQKGLLPCEATVLKARILALLRLEQKIPGVRPRYLLARSPATLRMHPHLIAATARRLVKLLPDRPLHALLVLLMPLLRDAEPDVLVCEMLELEHTLQPVWGDAPAPTRLMQAWLSQRAAQYKATEVCFRQQQQARLKQAKVARRLSSCKASQVTQPLPDPGVAQECVDLTTSTTASEPPVSNIRSRNTGTSSSGDAQFEHASVVRLVDVQKLSMLGFGAASGGSRRYAVHRPAVPSPSADEVLQLLRVVQQMHADAGQSSDSVLLSSAAADPGGASGSQATWSGDAAAEQEAGVLTLDNTLASCQHLAGLLGHEPAYMVLCKAPSLVHASKEQTAHGFDALRVALKCTPPVAALLIQREPRLLTVTADVLSAQLSGLRIALGWKPGDVSILVQSCPRAVIMSPTAVSSQWRQLQSHSVARPGWESQVANSPASCLALLLNRPDPGQCLARLQYLARHPRDMSKASLEYVLKLSQPAFLQQCAGYLRRT